MINELENYGILNCHLAAINWTKLKAEVVVS
jgi:hypothetical protein